MSLSINTIYNEDCLDTMARMSDGFIDLTVTSPPYDNLRSYEGYYFSFENIAKELFRVTKQGGIVVWVVGDSTDNLTESGTSFRQALFFKNIGFKLYDTMIFEKENKIPLTHRRYEQAFEYMFVMSKGRPVTFNPIKIPCIFAGKTNHNSTYRHRAGYTELAHSLKDIGKDKIKGNIWSYQVGFGKSSKDKKTFEHPAVFPEQLAEDHILSWSNEGELVYDPFMGSGTTAKMAIVNNRNFIGSELSGVYCKLAQERIFSGN